MKCSNCGNEIEEGEKFCGKCGKLVNTNTNVATNENVQSKRSITKTLKAHKVLVCVFIILVCILVICIYMSYINNLSSPSANINYNTSTTNNKSAQKKSYYSFIDTDYYTFDFTEEELIRNIMKGNNYYQMGYNKSASTNDSNTMLYSALSSDGGGVEIISITTEPRNLKVKSFKLSFVSHNTLTKEKVESYLRTFAVIASSSLLELPGDYNSEETTQLAEDIIMNNGEKGVTWTSNYDTRNIEFTLTATK